MEKLITKSFKRLLDKGIHRGFITYEELGKSLGKRHLSQQNVESAFLHIFEFASLPWLKPVTIYIATALLIISALQYFRDFYIAHKKHRAQ